MTRPALMEVRSWIDVDPGQLDDGQLGQVIAAELLNQAAVCRVPADDADYPEDLKQALLRRVARHVALRGIPLGIQFVGGDAFNGAARVGGLDVEIRRLEQPYRRLVAG